MSPVARDPSVEERLRASLVLSATLRQSATAADQFTLTGADVFSPAAVVSSTPAICDLVIAHLQAVKAVLPAACMNLPAPAPARGGAR